MLEFRSRGNQPSDGDLLNDVSVVGTGINTSTASEPSSFVLLGGGVSLSGFIARWRRRVCAAPADTYDNAMRA
ncbi:hypothetical protein [Gemmatimonas sp.]|jgi:hypothetical protein|uniref:hypothetical protein n=1 Tax=Gemmatimonas sp. TaxID=1962908 RepID=UPI0031BD6778|nr:hypothetical protein [Gemmatimonas sp.]